MQYSRDVQDLHEYQEISAPVINNNKLWIISGHWAHYVNNMFIIPGKDEDEKYTVESVDTMAAKPMNCPNAMMEFGRKPRSYKELPIRYSEYDVLSRTRSTRPSASLTERSSPQDPRTSWAISSSGTTRKQF